MYGTSLYRSDHNIISKNDITFNEYGIKIESSLRNEILNNTISGNDIGLYLHDHSDGNIAHFNELSGNKDYAVDTTPNVFSGLYATYNWWGDETGPHHSSKNPGGRGDNITGILDFDPWIGKPNTKPVVMITSPANHTEVSGTVNIAGTASDDDGDDILEKIEVSINNGEWKILTGTTSWSFTWDTRNVENGEHSLRVRAFDGDDYSGIVEIVLEVLNEPQNNRPAVYITAPANHSVVSDRIAIRGNASDEDGNLTIQKVEVAINGGKWQVVNGTSAWIFRWDTAGLENGEYTLKFRAFDGMEHSVFKEIVLIVENDMPNKKPTITVTSHENRSLVSGIVTISGSASDEDGDETIEKVMVSINDGGWEDVTGTSTWSFEWDTRNGENGEHSLKFRASDGSDFSDPGYIVLSVNNKPENTKPTIAIISPAMNSMVSGTITISGSASDGDGEGTIERIEVSINDDNWVIATGTRPWRYQWNTVFVPDGTCRIRVRAYDGEDYSDVLVWELEVKNKKDGEDKNSSPCGFFTLTVAMVPLVYIAQRKQG